MEQKTRVHAESGTQHLVITRDFDLPVSLLFKAHTEPELFEQWMSHEFGTVKVKEFDLTDHGSWAFETLAPDGSVLFAARGVIHNIESERRITRTFEMLDSPFEVQLEYLEFEKTGDEASRLTMQSIFRSAELRDQLMQLPFAEGLSAAHDRLQTTLGDNEK